MRIWNGGGHEELERVVPRNALITEFELAALVDLLEQDRFESRVEFFTDIFD
jgi:hypothetical protein